MTTSTDRIEKEILLKAPRARVWRALTRTAELNAWFNVALEGTFETGARVKGPITLEGYSHLTMDVVVEEMEPERIFSFRWHPYAVDPEHDYTTEPTTLVRFELSEVEGGTLLRVVESGFDAIPAGRRPEAFRMNTSGWEHQLRNVARYLEAKG